MISLDDETERLSLSQSSRLIELFVERIDDRSSKRYYETIIEPFALTSTSVASPTFFFRFLRHKEVAK